MEDDHRQHLGELSRHVAQLHFNPMVLRQLGKAFGLLALVMSAVFVPMAIVERSLLPLLLVVLILGSAMALCLLVVFACAGAWRRETIAAIEAAMAREPLLAFRTESNGLMFIDQTGYFVERPALAYQPFVSPFFMVESIRLAEDAHALEFRIAFRMKALWQHKTDRISLPPSISSQEVLNALEGCVFADPMEEANRR